MKVTFILENKSECYFKGNAERLPEGHVMRVVGLDNLPSNAARFAQLQKDTNNGFAKMKVGSGAFRDRVELNQILRKSPEPSYKLEPRKGYKLATFNFSC